MLIVGAFELIEPVAQGGAGAVWRAMHRPSGEPVAIKVLSEEVARDALYRRAFRNEIRAPARLDHPHIIRMRDHGRISAQAAAADARLPEGAPWLAMEWVAGGRLVPLEVQSWDATADLAMALLSALAHCHGRGVVHRDIKPGNVLMAGADEAVPGPRLTDFAISSRRTQGPDTVPRMGTPEYMPPERIRETWWEEAPSSDLYSLGCLLWRVLTGDLPHGGVGTDEIVQARLTGRLLPFTPRFAVPEGTEEWLHSLLSVRVGGRPVSAAQAARGLLAVGVPAPLGGRRRTAWEARLAVAHASGGMPPRWEADRSQGAGPDVVNRLELRPVPSVARQPERDQLWDALGSVAETGRPQLVVLHGPSGFGKTHLADWLGAQADELGLAEVLRAVHDEGQGPQHGLGPMFARWLRVLGLDERSSLPVVQARLDQLGVDATDVALSVADLVWSGRVARRPRFQHPQERHALIRAVLDGLGRHRAVVMVLDDLQWGPEACAFARSVLSGEGEPLPLLLVATWASDVGSARVPVNLDTLLSHPQAQGLAIGPLEPEDQRALLRSHLGLVDELAAAIQERAGGNPSYMLQLVETWSQRGVLEPCERGWRLVEGASVSSPRGVREAWLGRIEPLLAEWPSTAGHCMELAATLGVHVRWREWTAVCRGLGLAPPFVLLEQLVDAGLVETGPGEDFGFVHAMLRDALCQRARAAEREQAHHQACARALSARFDPGRAGRLGRHLLAGGDPGAAVAPLAQAAEAAMDAGEYARGRVLMIDHDAAVAAAQLAPDDPRWGNGWLLWCRLLQVLGRESEVEAFAKQTVAAGEAHDWGAELIRGYVNLARSAVRVGRLEDAMALLDRADRRLRELDDSVLEGEVLRARGVVLVRLGQLGPAREHLDRALTHLPEDTLPLRRAGTLLELANVQRQLGDVDDAERLAGLARDLYLWTGSRWGVGNAFNLLGEVARDRGQHDAAVEHYRQALHCHEAVGPTLAVVPRVNLGLALVEAGRAEEAWTWLTEVEDGLDEDSSTDLVATVHAGLAAAAGQREDWSAAALHLEALEGPLHGGYVDRDLGTLFELLGATAAQLGEPAFAQRALALALRQWTVLGAAAAVDRVGGRLAALSAAQE